MFKILLSKEIFLNTDELKSIAKLFLYEIQHSHPYTDKGFIIEEFEGIYKAIFEDIISQLDIDDLTDIRISESITTVTISLKFGE